MVKWGLVRWPGPHLLHGLVEEVEDAVLVLGLPPALHVVLQEPQHTARWDQNRAVSHRNPVTSTLPIPTAAPGGGS